MRFSPCGSWNASSTSFLPLRLGEAYEASMCVLRIIFSIHSRFLSETRLPSSPICPLLIYTRLCVCHEIQAVEEQPGTNHSQTQSRDGQQVAMICDNATWQMQVDELLCTKLLRVIKMGTWLGVEMDRDDAKGQNVDLVMAMCNDGARAEITRLENLSSSIKNSL